VILYQQLLHSKIVQRQSWVERPQYKYSIELQWRNWTPKTTKC